MLIRYKFLVKRGSTYVSEPNLVQPPFEMCGRNILSSYETIIESSLNVESACEDIVGVGQSSVIQMQYIGDSDSKSHYGVELAAHKPLTCSVCIPRQAVSDLSKFQSLCEEVIDLDHLRQSGGKQVRVRPQFHVQLQRLGEELSGADGEMAEILREVEKATKVGV